MLVLVPFKKKLDVIATGVAQYSWNSSETSTVFFSDFSLRNGGELIPMIVTIEKNIVNDLPWKKVNDLLRTAPAVNFFCLQN